MKLRYYLRGLGIGILVTAFLMGAAQGNRKGTLSDEEIKARAAELGMVENLVLADLGGDGAEPSVKERQTEMGISGSEGSVESVEPSGSSAPEESTKPSESSAPVENVKPPESSAPEVSAKPSESSEPAESKKPSSGSSESAENPKPSGGKEPAEDIKPSESGASVENIEPSENKQAADITGASVTVTIKRGDSSVAVSKALAAAGLVADAKAYDRFLCAGGYDKTLSVGSYEIPVGAGDEEIARIITRKN